MHAAVDVGDYEAVDKAVTSVMDSFGQIDILVNNVRLSSSQTRREVFAELTVA